MMRPGVLPDGALRALRHRPILDPHNLPFGSGREQTEADEDYRRRRRVDPNIRFTRRCLVVHDRDKDFLRWLFLTDEYEAQRQAVYGIYRMQTIEAPPGTPPLPVIARVYGFYISYCKDAAPVYRIGYALQGLITVQGFRDWVAQRCPAKPFEKFIKHLSQTMERLMLGDPSLPRSYQKFIPFVTEMQTWYLSA